MTRRRAPSSSLDYDVTEERTRRPSGGTGRQDASAHLADVAAVVAHVPRHLHRVDPQHRDLLAHEVDAHVLLALEPLQVGARVRQVLVDHGRGDGHRGRVQHRAADQREVAAAGQQHLLQPDAVAHFRRPVPVHQDQVVVGDLELLAAQVHHGEQPVLAARGPVNGRQHVVGERLARGRHGLVVYHVLLSGGRRPGGRGGAEQTRGGHGGRRAASGRGRGLAHETQHSAAQHGDGGGDGTLRFRDFARRSDGHDGHRVVRGARVDRASFKSFRRLHTASMMNSIRPIPRDETRRRRYYHNLK